MKFNNPQVVESICWQMRMADYTRSQNRALINNLFNGFPPYSKSEEQENNIEVNVNFLEGTRLSHDARTQFYQAMLKPGNFFKSTCDMGPVHKRKEWSAIVTKERNKIMKSSMPYIETTRSGIAMNVLHGIAPCGYRDKERWRPYSLGIEDVYVPSGTLLTMENLPFFAIYRSMTAPEMVRLTQAKSLDPAWNRKMLNAAIKWVDKESQTLMYNNWPEVWAPEKTAERMKGDGGFYYGDQVPTINVFDFYFWNDEGKVSGWNRRMILDAWSMPENLKGSITAPSPSRRSGKLFDEYKSQFLYDPGNRKEADSIEEIVNWQFADLSAVAPFRYHSVRSLGFLLYSVCHLQNRLRCKFNESVFEQLMMYFRVTGEEDAQRALKVSLANRGFIDQSINFIPPTERYQVNAQLASLGLAQNERLITENSSSYTQNQNFSRDSVEKTKFQVMAEVNASTTLISASLAQSYIYKNAEYREIARRFAIKESVDPEVRKFQANCLRQGVDPKVLYNPSCWEHEAERVMGAGNKTLEMAIAEALMQYRHLYDPESQRDILKDFTLAISDDAAFANRLVPESPMKITSSVHDAQLAAGALLQGLPVAITKGMNHIEYVDTLMATLMSVIQQAAQIPVSMERLSGMFNMAANIQQHIEFIAEDKNEGPRVSQYQSALGQMQNAMKQIAKQPMEQEQQQSTSQNGGIDAETQAKIQSMLIQSQAKAENTKTAHAQRTAHRQVQFEMEQARKDRELEERIKRDTISALNDTKIRDVEAMNEMRLSRMAASNDMRLDDVYAANDIMTERAKSSSKSKNVDKES